MGRSMLWVRIILCPCGVACMGLWCYGRYGVLGALVL